MNFNAMKYLISLIIFAFCIKAQAAHWFTFYVYYETEYVQGPWSKAYILDGSNYKYLTVEKHEKLLGTVDEDLVDTLISTLREIKPDLYNWEYDLKIDQNVVEITAIGFIENQQTIKNELIATILLNNFETLKLNYNGKSENLTLNDITLPYFDLVSHQMNEETPVETINSEENPDVQNIANDSDTKNNLIYWLIASVLLNFGIITYVLFKKKA